ncbi:MAG: hypothetical protein ACR2QB_00675 [Gammaproteobacteria bacterium]
MTTESNTQSNPTEPPPAAAALGFVCGVALLGFVSLFGAVLLT